MNGSAETVATLTQSAEVLGSVKRRGHFVLGRVSNDKSASVYECFPFIWPYNARCSLVPMPKRLDLSQWVADNTDKWIGEANLHRAWKR
jgi:hypothetical protein